MKKYFAFVMALVCAVAVMAQNDEYDDQYCKGLKNPTSFVISGTNTAHASWSGQIGTKASQASTCDNWAGTGLTLVPASQLAAQASGSSCTPGNEAATHQNRFLIVYPGTDDLTGNHLQKVPAGFTSAVRLGNRCGGTGAEMLMYQFDVKLKNSLVILNYALSLQNGQHSAAQNPEFTITVEKKVGNNWVRIGHDTLCYIQQTPTSSASTLTGADTVFFVGSTGTHTGASYGVNIYTNWRRVAINLNNYLFETVRIKIGAGDCAQTAHYAYAYFAAECQAMEIKTSGCPVGESNYVQRLTAPTGLETYVWKRCASGKEFIHNLTSVDENVAHFINVVGTTNSATPNVYDCQAGDFLLTEGSNAGSYTNTQVFSCTMTSRMNASIPFTSKVYVEVINKKPLAAVDTTIKDCDGRITLKDLSYVPGLANGVDTTRTEWWIYSGANTSTPLDTTMLGSLMMRQFDSHTPGIHAVKMRSHATRNPNDPGDTLACYTDKEFTIYSLGRPVPIISANTTELCDGEQVALTDRTQRLSPQLPQGRDWIYDGDTLWCVQNGQLQDILPTYSRTFTRYENTVYMRAYNGLYYLDREDQTIKHWCTDTSSIVVHMFSHPELYVTGDSVVCNGETTNMTVSTETDSCTYKWYTQLRGTNSIQTGATLTQYPYADTCTYYVKVTSPQGCEAWDSVHAYVVRPTLGIDKYDMCAGDSVRLFSGAADHYSWTAEPADASLDKLLDTNGFGPAEIKVRPNTTTTYTMVGHGTNGCSADPLQKTITVHPLPVAKVTYDPVFVDSADPKVTFNDVSPYSVMTYWFFPNVDAPVSMPTYMHDFGEVADDSVDVRLVTANDLGCTDTLDFSLPVVLFTFYAPNAFTPERPEAENNVFRFYTINEMENFHIYIYDRAGRLVYTSQDLHFAWDGTTMDGKKCPQGTYVYVATYRRPMTEDIVTQKGAVTLIR